MDGTSRRTISTDMASILSSDHQFRLWRLGCVLYFWPFPPPTCLDVEMRVRAQSVLKLFRSAALRRARNRSAVISKQFPIVRRSCQSMLSSSVSHHSSWGISVQLLSGPGDQHQCALQQSGDPWPRWHLHAHTKGHRRVEVRMRSTSRSTFLLILAAIAESRPPRRGASQCWNFLIQQAQNCSLNLLTALR